MDAEPGFVDTNVLVYASRTRAASYPRAIAWLRQARDDGRALWVSRQVLREYLAVVTRPQADLPILPMSAARADVEGFLRDFNVVDFRRFAGSIALDPLPPD